MKAMNTLSSLSRFAVAAGASLKPFAACLLVLGALAVVTGGGGAPPPPPRAIVRKDPARAEAPVGRGRGPRGSRAGLFRQRRKVEVGRQGIEGAQERRGGLGRRA